MGRVVIVMGSKADLKHCKKIAESLEGLGVESVMHVASAHKVPLKALEILERYKDENVVFITVAGYSNALSGFSDANTALPVIACPPVSDSFGGVDIFSSLRMPSGVAPLTVLGTGQAALAAAKILALADRRLQERVRQYQQELKDQLERDDAELQR